MNILATAEGLDGHDQLAALMRANVHPPIGVTLEFALVELERGRVVFEGSPSRKVFNPIGSVHGGYAATLLDSACGCAVHSSLPAGHGYTTLELKVAYHRALSDTSGPARAEGKLVAGHDLSDRQINAISFGKNRWAIMPTAAFTYLNPDSGHEFSVSTGITVSARNDATEYQTAPEWIVEAAAMQHLPNGLALCLAGYAYQQLGEDCGAGAEQMRALADADSLQARVFGLGPEMTWNTKVGDMPLSLKAKYTPEFGAKRRFESDVLWLTLGLTF